MEGYVVSFVVFYEQGFVMPLHQFLRSLLQHYCLELHNLTLCEVYMGIDPHFDLWNYFFHV
jgi:hypothetical protein